MRGRRASRPHRFAVGVGIGVALFLVLWGIGLVRFADSIPERVPDAYTQTDAIIVLTGGTHRLAEGIELLALDKAKKLFVSGVYQGVDVRHLLQLVKRTPRHLEDRVGIGNATNTQGNATETAEWMKREGFHSLRLVTAAYHMPRSVLEFRHAMPTAEIVAHPVFPETVKADWWAWPGTAALIVGEYNKSVFAWVRQRGERLLGGGAP